MSRYNLRAAEMVETKPSFEKFVGFLSVPNTKGERPPCHFEGVIKAYFQYEDSNRKNRQMRHAVIVEATQDGATYWDRDDEVEKPIKEGMNIAVNLSGALYGLRPESEADEKIGHFVTLDFTGEKFDTKNGEMMNVESKISAAPVKTLDEEKAEKAVAKNGAGKAGKTGKTPESREAGVSGVTP